ncbi:MAG TPA: TetR/AcrR family transcriptional regulator [Kofleriaceae bacterium]|nr:TetR/AcrR family transcriptional regulator [Kofleriaceae bacterium]
MARRAQRSPEAVLRGTPDPDFRQERSRRSYQALLDAAAELFAEHGYDAVGTPEIAQRAGVSVGTFYRYFDDKHEVYLEIMRRTIATAYEETIAGLTPERFVGASRTETIARAVDILFDHVLSRPQLTRSFMEMSLRDAAVAELRRAFEQLATQRLAALIAAVTARDVVPDPEAFAYVLHGSAMQAAYGLAVHLVPPALDRDRARAALTAFIERAMFR